MMFSHTYLLKRKPRILFKQFQADRCLLLATVFVKLMFLKYARRREAGGQL